MTFDEGIKKFFKIAFKLDEKSLMMFKAKRTKFLYSNVVRKIFRNQEM